MKIQILKTGRSCGSTYMTVFVVMILFGTMLAAYLKMVGSQNQQTMRSQTWNRSVAVLEAGIEEALAHLNKNASADASGVFTMNLNGDGWTAAAGGGWSKSNRVDGDYYLVTITDFVAGNYYPNIISEGYVQQIPTFTALKWMGPFLAQSTPNTTATYVKRQVVCTTTNVPTFTKALVAKYGIDLSGQNVKTDSFDSGNPDYNDGFGHYTNSPPSKWRTNGDIASNNTITNTISTGNANIYGKVATGPHGTVNLGSSGMVGDKAWQDNAANKGKIQPGWSTDDMNVEFPNVTVPSVTWSPVGGGHKDVLQADGTTVRYTTVLDRDGDYTLPAGQTLSGNVYVDAKARLLVQSKIAMSGQDRITITTNGSLQLFADCPSVALGGNGIQNTGLATNFYYFGTTNNTSLGYGGNAAFTAVFYAPNAAMTMGGGGSATVDFSGAAIIKSVKMNGNFTFHYDENLKRIGLYRGYIVTSWNER